MTLNRLVGFGLLSASVLLGLGGCGEKDGDDSAPSDDSVVQDDDLDDDGLTNEEEDALGTDPEEADTDGDGCDDKDEIDEGHDPLDDSDDCEYFEATVMFVSLRTGYDQAGLSGYTGVDSSGAAFNQETPWVEVQLVTDDYFDAYDDRYACTWLGNVVPASGSNYVLDDFGVADLWAGYAVKLELVVAEDGTPQTDCYDFDPTVWGEDSPTTIIEATEFGVGFGPMSGEFAGTLQTAVEGAALDWDLDWAPYVFSYYLGFADLTSGEVSVGEIGFGFAYELDEQMGFVYDEAGESITRELGPDGTVDELPPYSFVSGGSLYGYYTYSITGE